MVNTSHFHTCRNMLKMRYMTPESAGAHRTVREGEGEGGGEVEGARSILFPSKRQSNLFILNFPLSLSLCISAGMGAAGRNYRRLPPELADGGESGTMGEGLVPVHWRGHDGRQVALT